MAIPFFSHIDLDQNELQNAVAHNAEQGDITTPKDGQFIFDNGTSVNKLKYYNGTSWVTLSGAIVDSVTSGNTNTITIGGTAEDPTVSANTAPVTNGSLNLATGDQIFDFVDGNYVALTDTLNFSGGDVTGSGAANSSINLTIGASAVEASMLNNNIISGKTALTSGLASTDEFLISDAGTVKRMDVSVLQTYMQSNLNFTSDTNTTYSLSVLAGATNTSIIRLSGSDATNDDVTISGTTSEISVTESGSTITIGLPNDVTIGNNLTVTGNLTVSGTTTIVNTETINLADNIITLNSNETGTPSQNAGIEIERGTSANVELRWNESTDKWQIETNPSTDTYGDIAVTSDIPTSGVDFDPVGTDNSTDVTLSGTPNYLTLSGQVITLNQVDWNTDISNKPTIPAAANNATITLSAGNSGITMDADNSFTTNQSGNETITISHADTSSQASVNNSGRTYIQDITLDDYGHITGITSATETVTNTNTQLATKVATIDVSNTTFITNKRATINHALASSNVTVQMYDTVTGQVVHGDVEFTSDGSTVSTNHVRIEFASVPPNDIKVIMIDAKASASSVTPSYA